MRRITLAAALPLLLLAASAFAQQQAALQFTKSHLGYTDETPFLVHSEVAEVGLQLAVTDRHGRAVMGLSREDLQVLDNGRLATITELRRDNDLPLRIALVIDWSDSMQKDLRFERRVARDFLRSALRPNLDQAMVVGFRYRVEVTQPFTGDLESLEAGIRPVSGAPLSSVYDALIAASDALQSADPFLRQRRAIVLLSDGEDNVSAHGLSDVVEVAERANITIYTISARQRRGGSAGNRALTALSKATGGRTFFIPASAEQLAFAHIEQDLRLGYALYFKPAAVGGEPFRSLEVKARDQHLQVWAPHSYYAGSQ